MPDFNFRHSKSSRLIAAVQPGLSLSIMLMLVLTLTACGDQNTPEASQGAAGSVQVSSSATGTSQGQAQPATTSAPPSSAPVASKITPKPASTAANVPAGTVHICSLLSKEEVAASVGGSDVVIDASRDALGEFGGAGCNYTSSTGGLSVEVTIAGQSQVDFEKNFKFNNAQMVPSLGDTAFFLDGQLSTLKGKVGVVVFLLNPANGSETLNNAIILTQKVLTALGKTSHASDLTSSVPASKVNKVTAADLPVYPGSVLVSDDSTAGFTITTYTSKDSYGAIVKWYKKAGAGKPWTANLSNEPEVGYTIISAGKATATTSSQLLISIKGPENTDRGAGSDAKGNPIVLSPEATLIILTLN